MAETFYGALGVSDDADSETIRRAYRERVKEHHPDVSDDPDAPERFKRLTTARNVLVDADERTRYDRQGHADYVEEHIESTAWDSSNVGNEPERAPAATSRERAGDDATTETGGGGYDRTAWLGDDGPGKRRQRRRQRRQRTGAAGGTATAEEWQHASKTYRRAETTVGTDRRSPVRSLLSALRAVGPWLLVHAIFVGSAVATSWLAFSELAGHVSVSWPTLVLGILLVGLAVFASVLHVVSQLYS